MKELTDITCIVDRSGSMAGLASDTIGSFNRFLEDQQSIPGDATIKVVLFNSHVFVLQETTPLQDCVKLSSSNYITSGGTALFDAVGSCIDQKGLELAALPEHERPNNVVFCIITDGENNQSYLYTQDMIRQKIEEQQGVYSWKFIFLAANQDAFQSGASLGISKAYTSQYDATAAGTQVAWNQQSKYLRSIRTKTPDTH